MRIPLETAAAVCALRRQLGGRAFGNDPDVFFLRDENCSLSPAQKRFLAETNVRYGQVLLISDDPSAYTPEMKEQYRSLRRKWAENTGFGSRP